MAPLELFVTRSVVRFITDSAIECDKRRREFGGSLLGLLDENRLIIAYAASTGPHAQQSASHLVTDQDYQNRAITDARARLPQLVYVGDWHVHPRDVNTLSPTDLATIREILTSDELGRGEFFALLGVPDTQGVTVKAYRASLRRRSEGGDDLPPSRPPQRYGHGLLLEEPRYETIDDDDPAITELIGRPLPDLRTAPPSHRGDGQDTRALVHPHAERIDEEVALLRGRGASVELVAFDDQPAARILWHHVTYHAVFWPDFPNNAPTLLRGDPNSQELERLPARFHWNTGDRVVDLLADAEDGRDIDNDGPNDRDNRGGDNYGPKRRGPWSDRARKRASDAYQRARDGVNGGPLIFANGFAVGLFFAAAIWTLVR